MSLELSGIGPGPRCIIHQIVNCLSCYKVMAPPRLKLYDNIAADEGYLAFARGQANDSNPYTVNPNLTMWSAGWHKGESELVEKNLALTLEHENLRKGQEHESVHLALEEVRGEIYSAKAKWPRRAASMHEQYAVILEELDELWGHVKFVILDAAPGTRMLGVPVYNEFSQRVGQLIAEPVEYSDGCRPVNHNEFEAEDRRT